MLTITDFLTNITEFQFDLPSLWEDLVQKVYEGHLNFNLSMQLSVTLFEGLPCCSQHICRACLCHKQYSS